MKSKIGHLPLVMHDTASAGTGVRPKDKEHDMKRAIESFFFAAAVTAAQFAFGVVPYSGQTTPGEYEISTFTQLTNFTKKVHAYDYAGSTIRLIADIDCQGRRFLHPTSRSAAHVHESDIDGFVFSGTFDGGGHRIYNFHNRSVGPDGYVPEHDALVAWDGEELPLDTTIPEDYPYPYPSLTHIRAHWREDLTDEMGSGLFVMFDTVKNGAVIKNLTLEGDVTGGETMNATDHSTAAFAREAEGANAVTFENCHFTGNIRSARDNFYHNSVFLSQAVGDDSASAANPVATFTNCTANVLGGGADFISRGDCVVVTDCAITNNSADSGFVGGSTRDSMLTRCSFTGAIVGEYAGGGMVTYASNTVFRSCTVQADIDLGLSSSDTGGVVGRTYGRTEFYDCSFTGSLCTSNSFGGFVGETYGTEIFSNCTVTASMSVHGDAEADWRVAGFAARVSSTEAKFIDCTVKASGRCIRSGFFDDHELKTDPGSDFLHPTFLPMDTNHFVRCSVLDTPVKDAGFARDAMGARFTDCVVSNVTSKSAGFAQDATNCVFTSCFVVGGSASNGFMSVALDANRFTDCSVLGTRVVNGFVGSANPDGMAGRSNGFWRCRVNANFSSSDSSVFHGFADELKSGTLVTDCVAYGFTTDDACELYGFVGTAGSGSTILGSVGAVLPPASAAKGAGFADTILSGATVEDCYSVYGPKVAATETDTENGVQGGFARKVAANPIRRCFALWPLPGSGSGTSHNGYGSFSGVGDDGRYEDCYRPAESAIWSVNNFEKEGISGLTAAQFANATSETFAGYDFTDTWRAPNGAASSPYLAASTDADGKIWTQITSGDGYGRVFVKQGNEYVEPAAAYPAGTVLTIKAVPGEGANFSRWIGEGVADPLSAETTYTVRNVGVVVATFDADLYAGQKEMGTYVIVSYQQIRQLTETARDYNYDGSTIIIQNDIDCGGGGIVGGSLRKRSSFWGAFKGKGNRIYNFRNVVSESDPYGAALFDELGPGAIIKDLTLEGDIFIESDKCTNAVVFAGSAYSNNIFPTAPLIDNCHFTGSISNVLGAAVFVGTAARGPYTDVPSVILSNCTANATVFTATNAVAGGLVVNVADAFATGCSFEGRVEGGWTLGGLAGIAQNSTFTNCTFAGEMAGGPLAKYAETLKNGGCGGLVGFASNSVFRACSANADIDWDYATGADGRTAAKCNFVAAGGAAGVTMGASVFDGCTFNGTVQSVHGYAGGFVGWTAGAELFTNCTTVASLNPTGSVQKIAIGGFAASVGSSGAEFINCTATTTGAIAGFFDVQEKCRAFGNIGENHFTRCAVTGTRADWAGFAQSATNAVFSRCVVGGSAAFNGFVRYSNDGCRYGDCIVTGATARVGFVFTTNGANTFDDCRVACLYAYNTGTTESEENEFPYSGFAYRIGGGAVVNDCVAYGAISANRYNEDCDEYAFATFVSEGAAVSNCVGGVSLSVAPRPDTKFANAIAEDAVAENCWSVYDEGADDNILSAAKDTHNHLWTHHVVVAGEGVILVDGEAPKYAYRKGTAVTIRAEPADGYEFSHWVGRGYGDPKVAETTYTPSNCGVIAAAFAKKVGTPEEFLAISDNPTVPYVLSGDIDMSGALGEGADGYLVRGRFKGRFHGRNHTISGILFRDTPFDGLHIPGITKAAVFEYLAPSAEIRDLTVEVAATNSYATVAGLAMDVKNYTLISNCCVKADFHAIPETVYHGIQYYGFASNVVGSSVKIMDCRTFGTIDSYNRAAGMFGSISIKAGGELLRCATFCDVSATAPDGIASGLANSLALGNASESGATAHEFVSVGTIVGSDTAAGIAASVSFANSSSKMHDMYSMAEVRANTGYGVAAGVARTISADVSAQHCCVSNVWFGGTTRAGWHRNYGFAESVDEGVDLRYCSFVDVPRADMQGLGVDQVVPINFATRVNALWWEGFDLDNVWTFAEGQTTPYFAWSLDNGNFRIHATRARGASIAHPNLASPGANVAVTAEVAPQSDAFFAWWDGGAAYANGTNATTTLVADNHRTVNCVWGRNISTPEQLQAVTDDLSGIYHVVSDIDMAGFSFETLGGICIDHYYRYDGYYPFYGIFEGNGHTISNLVASNSFVPHNGTTETYGGLFGRLREARVEGVRLFAPQVVSFNNSGAIAGEAISSAITNCAAIGSYVGGSGTGASGGVVGALDASSVSRSFAAGYVGGYNVTGGFVGSVTNSVISESFASGAAKATMTTTYCGGFAGEVRDGTAISDCYTISEVEGAGGFAALVNGDDVSFARCYSAGLVKGTSGGGFIGNAYQSSPTITDCVRRHYDIYTRFRIADVGNADHEGVVALTADEMRAVTNFTAFLEARTSGSSSLPIWAQENGATHPFFAWSIEDGMMPVVSMTVGRDALAEVRVNYARLSGMTALTPGGIVSIVAEGPRTSATFVNGRTFLEWTGVNDDFGEPFLPSTQVKADNFRTALAMYGVMISHNTDLYNITNNLTGTYGLANNVAIPDDWASLHQYPNYYAFKGRLYGAGHSINVSGDKNVFYEIDGAYFRGLKVQGNLTHYGQTCGALSDISRGAVILQDCSVNCSITTGNSSLVGGFFGEVVNGTVTFERCAAYGTIQSQSCVGGFVGCVRSGSSSGTFIDCTSDVEISGGNDLGGMIGEIESTGGTFSFLRCVANGDMNGNGDGVAGLIGSSYSRIVCEDSRANGNVTSGGNSFPGGFIAELTSNAARSSFRNCHASGRVTNTNSNMDGAGGFVGDLYAPYTTFTDCSASGDVSNYGSYSVGGFAGRVYGEDVSFTNCVASGTVTGVSGLGGFVGSVTGNRSSFVDCEARGYVSAWTRAKGTCYGGFVGTSGSSSAAITYEGCRALGGVSASAGDYIGGFVGYVAGADAYRRCMSAGLVKGDTCVGGFVGRFYCTGVNVGECFALGDVVCHKGPVGGFAGYIERAAAISDSYAIGNVTGWGNYVGGFAGQVASDSSLNRCYTAGVVKGYDSKTGSFAGSLDSSVSVTNCVALSGGVSSYPVGIVPTHAIGNSYTNTTEHANIVELGGTSFKNRANFTAFLEARTSGSSSLPIWAQVDGVTQPYLAWSAPNGNLSVYTLVYGSGGGTVSGGGEYEPGEEVEISATPDDNRFFAGWTGSAPYADATNAHTTLTLDNHRAATTQFGRYVSDADELQAIVNDLDGVFGLACDIDLANLKVETEAGPQTTTWRPIGFPGNGNNFAFTGKLFGFGHVIDNLVCTNSFARSTGYVGLFGDVSFATLDSIEVSGRVWGEQEIGGLAGRVRGTLITNCVARVEVSPLGVNFSGPVGGLVGSTRGTTVVGCRADGFVKGGGRVGGLVGMAGYFSAFFDSAARGDVCGVVGGYGHSYGGFAGYLSTDTGWWASIEETDAVVSNCWCSGTVWGRETAVGSFAGDGGRATTVIDCAVADGRTAKRRPSCGNDIPCRILSAEEVAERTAGWPAPLERDFSEAVHISTAEELAAVANAPSGIYFLENDINLNNTIYTNWTPIGTSSKPFEGEFYGNGHRISNFKVSASGEREGFFGAIAGGRISGLRLKGRVSVAGTSNNNPSAGGFAGRIVSGSLVEDCSFRGDVVCNDKYVGGFAGIIAGASMVAGCCVTGRVEQTVTSSHQGCGGFVGYVEGGDVRIFDCFSLDSVDARDNDYAGGFVGYIDSGYSDTKYRLIDTSYCSGSVTNTTAYRGAFIGYVYNRTSVTNSYYDSDATTMLARGTSTTGASQATPGVTPLTHGEMLHAANFTPFDFAKTWKIDEGETTPYLVETGKFLRGFEQWLSENGLPIDTDSADVTNGVPYLIRYAFDVPTAPFSPFLGIAFNANGDVAIKTMEIKNDEGVTIKWFSSTSLTEGWEEVDSEEVTIESDGTLVFRKTDDPARFYKFKAVE